VDGAVDAEEARFLPRMAQHGAARYAGFDWTSLERSALPLLEHASARVRGNAAVILGLCGCEAAQARILSMAADDEDGRARWRSVETLRYFPPSDDAFRLLLTAARDPHNSVRCYANRGLGRHGERGEDVSRSLPDDPDLEVAGVCERVLARLAKRHSRRNRHSGQ
jgi:hypothetical protein